MGVVGMRGRKGMSVLAAVAVWMLGSSILGCSAPEPGVDAAPPAQDSMGSAPADESGTQQQEDEER
jgi:hypothetical protein